MKELFNLTNPQKSIWVTEEFYKGMSIENIAGTAMLSQEVNFDKLEEAINIFIKTNDSFRLKFIKKNNEVKQYIDTFSQFSFEKVNVKSEKDVKEIEKELSQTPLETTDSFLFNIKFFRFEDGHGGFVIVMHHLIVDAWAAGLVISRIIDIYDALLSSTFNLENFSNPSYTEYIASEQKYLSSNKFEKDKDFWNTLFATIPESVTIPGSLSNQNISSSAKRKLFKIPAKTMEFITSFCAENKISPFNFFMGIYALYLSRVSNLDEFVIGTPILNRSNAKEKHTVGMFISVVPFKVQLDYTKSFAEFTSGISADFFNIFRHQKYPYQTLLEDLRKRNSSMPNLYNIVLSYQNMRNNKQSAATDYEASWLFNGNISDDMEIHFFDINDTGIINVAYDYKTAKYTSDDIYALHSRILHIINQIIENNDILLKQIEIITPDEKNKILNEFNNTKMDYPKDKTIVQLFEEQVAKTPDNIALVFEDQKLTYRELNEKANSLAFYLSNQKVSRNDVIAIHLQKNIEYIISIIAILKCGATFLPISTMHPKNRIEYILNNSNCKILISNQTLIKDISYSCEYLDISSFKYRLGQSVFVKSNSFDTAYILYTSGSTGNPKGVKIRNYSIINHVYGINKKFNYSITSKDITLSIANISFDAHLQEIFIPLLLGASLHLLSDDSIYNIKFLADYICKNHITFTFLPPNILDDIYKLLSNNTDNIFLNKMLVGVEAISYSTLNNFLRLNENMQIHNGYGPTEATICCVSYMYNKSNQVFSNDFLPIGTPSSNTYIGIINSETGKLQPYNTLGEIIIGGDCVSCGYTVDSLNKSFVYNTDFNTICYHTGDYGYFRNDGNIVFAGRFDNQVKINGHRIELQEIDKILQTYPQIIKSISIVKNKKIITYFKATTNVNLRDLKTFIRNYLPSYMVPNKIFQIDNIPMTINGKVDMKALEKLEIIENRKEIQKPCNEVEQSLYEIFSKHLNIQDFSINDGFFDLGGDSLSAIRLSLEIYNIFKVDITVQTIFENSSIKQLADIIQNSVQHSIVTIPHAKEKPYYPASSAQKRIYFASSMAGESSTLYNVPGGIILDGKIDANKLEKCFNELIKRHETLRTYFTFENNNVVQKIINKVDFKLDLKENCSFDDLGVIFKTFVKPFDLAKAPLFRAKFIKFTNKKSALFVDMHHIISDGTSLSIFINELCKLYNDETLPELNITYKDFAVFENQRLTSGSLKEAEKYWVNQFKDDIPVLNLPTNYQRPATQSFEGSKVYSSIDLETTNKINNISKSLGVTPYMILLSAYYILLEKYTSQNDIVVGSPIVGRDIAETYNLIGMFVNTLALRTKIDSKQSFKELLETVKTNCLNAYKYQSYPFDELVNKLNIQRDSSRSPLFDTMFTYQNNGLKSIPFNNVATEYYIPDTDISKFDLSLELVPNKNGISISFEYATKLFNEDFIKNLSNHYLNILNAILENNNIKIADICMLSEAEKNIILNDFNNTKLEYPKDLTVVQLFEEQVEQNPDGIAVVFEGEKLTYRELNAKANCLAHYIQNSRIAKNSTIGIMLNRSLEMVISIVAVLKAGCTYVLIDHAFPETRVNYILENSDAKLLIIDNNYNGSFENICRIDQFEFNQTYKNLQIVNIPEDSFALIYTSGSTGNPKGVVLKHAGLVNLVSNYYQKFLFSSKTKSTLGCASISFDMFAVELFTSILLGGTLYLLNEEEHKNPVKMAEVIINNNVNFCVTTPTKIELLLSNPNTQKCLSVLDTIQLGGEVFSSSLYERLKPLTSANIYNGYGPTEITACCSGKLIKCADNINIGKPIPNMKIYITDKDGNLCPIGVPGELCVSGVGLAQGYINDAEKTEKSFAISKFNNERIYKTGDIALFNSNGEIEYIGRNDFQVKINGLRIELSEIEKQLLSIKEIQNCVVISDTKKTYLKAFIVAKDTLSIPSIRKTLAENLPTYMVPKYIIQIDSIPLTSNGKVDRKVLDSYEFSLSNEEIDYVAPETDLQIAFCEIWEDILQSKVGIDNDLFELGADSLSAIKFKVEALNKGIDVPYADIFKYKTIRKLSTSKTEEIITTPIEEFDYDAIHKLLKRNKIKSNYNIINSVNNNILLFGSNGFVGMHIINSFIKKDTGTIYCIMRDKNGKGALNRFLDVLHFYFGDTLDSFIGNRIIVLRGDIIKPNFGLSARSYNTVINNVSTIINAAANVKHFGDFDKFKNINIDATKQAIEFCKKYSKRLIHLSTLSISGNMFLDDTISLNKLKNTKKVYFSERNLFINQSLDNVYTRSKFEAEKIVLENIASGDLDALVLRLGNITSRKSDGKFQINPDSNAFTNRLKTFILLGMIPQSLLNQKIEFTAVDLCADAIIKCLQNKSKNISVLHIYNRNHTNIATLLRTIKNMGYNVKIVKDSVFAKYLEDNLSNPDLKKTIQGIINDLTIDKKISYKTNTFIKSDLSVNFLLRCKFKWGKIRKDYIEKYINYLNTIGFFK